MVLRYDMKRYKEKIKSDCKIILYHSISIDSINIVSYYDIVTLTTGYSPCSTHMIDR
jgi:hypothetical protein